MQKVSIIFTIYSYVTNIKMFNHFIKNHKINMVVDYTGFQVGLEIR